MATCMKCGDETYSQDNVCVYCSPDKYDEQGVNQCIQCAGFFHTEYQENDFCSNRCEELYEAKYDPYEYDADSRYGSY